MWHDHMWNGSWVMGWGIAPMLFFWLFVIGVIVYLFRALTARREASTDDSSLLILKDRLASGDIDQAEFDSLYQKLKRSQ